MQVQTSQTTNNGVKHQTRRVGIGSVIDVFREWCFLLKFGEHGVVETGRMGSISVPYGNLLEEAV